MGEFCLSTPYTLWRLIHFQLTFVSTDFTESKENICIFLVLQEGGPLPGPETGLLSNTRKWIVRDTFADKPRDFTGKGPRVDSSKVREPRRTALPHGPQSRVLWWWDWFLGGLWPIILIHSLSWGTLITQSRWMLSGGILGTGRTRSVFFQH